MAVLDSKNKFVQVVAGLALLAIGFATGYGLYHSKQDKYLVLNEDHPGAPAMLSFYAMQERSLLSISQKFKKKNIMLPYRIKEITRRDSYMYERYGDIGREVNRLSDTVIKELHIVFDRLIEEKKRGEITQWRGGI